MFRIMLGTATLVLVGRGMEVTKCVCGYCTVSQLCMGMHWFSMQLLSYNPADDDAQ